MQICEKCGSTSIKINKTYKYHDIYECQLCGYWSYSRIETCCRNPYKIVTIDRKDHFLFFLYEQCLNCNGSINRTKPLSAKKNSDKIRGEFSISTYEFWLKERSQEMKDISLSKKNYDYVNSAYYKYEQYLNSKEWKKLRKIIFERDKNKCCICKINEASDVHHLTYKNLFNEKMEDLISVCRDCHLEIHKNLENELILKFNSKDAK